MEQVLHMVGGEDEASYAKNSFQQKLVLREANSVLVKGIEELLKDFEYLPSCIRVSDLGCSSGPNAYLTAEYIIESIGKACEITRNHAQELPLVTEIQYFLNDLVSNDFNLVFKGLPEFYEKLAAKASDTKNFKLSCLISAMPGSFHGKLFPDNSMHFQHSSYCLQWLSQTPKVMVTETGISMNKRNIYCARRSPLTVKKAYSDQFRHDFTTFLRMRYRELVQQGQLLLTYLCENCEEEDGHNSLHLMGSALSDMVDEGTIPEDKLESFNVPLHIASVNEIRDTIEEEGSFKILKFHNFLAPMDVGYELSVFGHDEDPVLGRARYVATYLRAVFEPVLTSHFGDAIMDDLFHKYADKLLYVLQNGQLQCNTVIISLKKKGKLSS